MNHENASHAQAEVREKIERMNAAVRSRDVDQIMRFYAADVTAFDAIGQLQFKGAAAYREHWAACMASCPDGGVFEIHELQVLASDGLAIAHWLARCGPDEAQAGWMRATQAWRQADGQWQIVHDHWSAPFDVETGKALFELGPQEQTA